LPHASNFNVVPDRASGYQVSEGTFENPEYLSPTIPYAAGSLLSTVDDMLRWSLALRRNTLIAERSKQLAFTDYRLAPLRREAFGALAHVAIGNQRLDRHRVERGDSLRYGRPHRR